MSANDVLFLNMYLMSYAAWLVGIIQDKDILVAIGMVAIMLVNGIWYSSKKKKGKQE